MRSYFDHNAISEGRKRVRDAHDNYVRVANTFFPALFMSADSVRERRVQGYLMVPRERRASLPTFHA